MAVNSGNDNNLNGSSNSPTTTYTPIERQPENAASGRISHVGGEEEDDANEFGSNTNSSTNTTQQQRTLTIAFWLLGLFNNSSYVIMIASAKTISEGGTALVFLANIVPSMLVKLTGPYWFDYVSYEKRMILAFGCMVGSFGLVASSSTTPTIQLWGVALGSLQSGLGEASLLGAAGKMQDCSQSCIGGFSSGTGLAGVFGFLWKFVWNEWLQCSMSTTLWLAQSLALAYIGIFWKFLQPHLQQQTNSGTHVMEEELQPLELTTYNHNSSNKTTTTETTTIISSNMSGTEGGLKHESASHHDDPLACPAPDEGNNPPSSSLQPIHTMTILQRARFIATQLWPYIIPLFVVYAAEYSLQAGTWTAIGFDREARDRFYEYGNWMYQAGVFVSRSSGSLGTAPMALLWLMPALQSLNVVLFALVAMNQNDATTVAWYNHYGVLLPGCFYVGLLGGAVYVHGYQRICADFAQADRREFALAATSVAESLGIVCADVVGLFLQACLYRTNHIDGAVVQCPI